LSADFWNLALAVGEVAS